MRNFWEAIQAAWFAVFFTLSSYWTYVYFLQEYTSPSADTRADVIVIGLIQFAMVVWIGYVPKYVSNKIETNSL